MACDYDVEHVEDRCEREMAESRLDSVENAIEILKEAEEHIMPFAKAACFRYLFDLGRQLREYEEWKKLVSEYPTLIAEMITDWEEFRESVEM